MPTDRSSRSWTFLTNHAHVLLAIARTPDLRLREIADLVGITERTAMQIVVDLEEDGYVHRERRGRRNHYTVDTAMRLRHPLEDHHQISDLLDAVTHRSPYPAPAPAPHGPPDADADAGAGQPGA